MMTQIYVERDGTGEDGSQSSEVEQI